MCVVFKVWPGATHFPDFLSKAGVKYWADQLQAFHQLAAFDGLWIDMNEASNFCTGDVCHTMLPTQGMPPTQSKCIHIHSMHYLTMSVDITFFCHHTYLFLLPFCVKLTLKINLVQELS